VRVRQKIRKIFFITSFSCTVFRIFDSVVGGENLLFLHGAFAMLPPLKRLEK
jgi:hypothetical protein